MLGSLVAGRISDWYIATSPGGAVGKRIQVVMAYLVGVAAMLLAFQWVPAGASALQAAIVFMIGFFLYGPQMLIGLCGAEIVGRRSVGASEGFLGWIAYLGAANAGVPLSLLVQQYGWGAFFVALLMACAVDSRCSRPSPARCRRCRGKPSSRGEKGQGGVEGERAGSEALKEGEGRVKLKKHFFNTRGFARSRRRTRDPSIEDARGRGGGAGYSRAPRTKKK